MKVDVGCGHRPHGDVNIDLYPEATIHRSHSLPLIDDKPLQVKKIKNFIRADAQYLPLRDETFETVRSRHVIEHVDNPLLMLKELIRVSTHQVVIFCPHRYGENRKWRVYYHKHRFNIKWFEKALSKLGYLFHAETTKWRYFPHFLLPIARLPYEIKITVFKGEK